MIRRLLFVYEPSNIGDSPRCFNFGHLATITPSLIKTNARWSRLVKKLLRNLGDIRSPANEYPLRLGKIYALNYELLPVQS